MGFWDTVAFDEVAGIKVRDPDTIQIMKDFMANGRFSRGVEVIADASLAFVGNIDLSIEQIVHSTVYDLFQPLPREFDLAVMDRFACYLPGWEMPKNNSEFLTGSFGFITDYLAEAFHYLFAHSNRYEEVNKRIRLGKNVEGRDEKGIKKTVCALLKILHSTGSPSDEEFEEYVAYAVECRRRVKEQMNKRKPDDEFAKINLSYFRPTGEEVVVFCPESKDALATQNPERKDQNVKSNTRDAASALAPDVLTESDAKQVEAVIEILEESLKEQHFTITYGATGYSYESIIGLYLPGVKEVMVEDSYIRLTHQIQNFTRLCETFLKFGAIKRINLITRFDTETDVASVHAKLDELKQSLLEADVTLDIQINPNLHDREIRLDNGWVIKIGRGLDFYQKPESYYEIGMFDLNLRKCLETKVDIFKKDE